MKIAVNTRLLLPGKFQGISWVAYETLKRITTQHPEHQFYFIFDRPYSEEFIFSSNVTPIVAYPPARHPYLWYLFFEYGVPHVLNRIKPDIFLSMDGWLSLRTKVPSLDVMHDLNFEYHPEYLKPVFSKYYRHYFPKFAQKAERIATVSEASRQDIHKLYHIPLEKIDVIYCGCNDVFRPFDEEKKIAIRNKCTQGNPFFLFVGSIQKRKNIDNIFRAFDLYKTTDQKNTKLVIVGERKWWKGDIEDAYLAMSNKEDVIFFDWLSEEELAEMTAASIAMLYPSLFEGFGIPILEGFHAETAVITSNVTSMPEVAGNAALLVEPHSPKAIADAMTVVARDSELRRQLIEKGILQREKFSWDLTAKRLWSSIEKIL